MAHRQRQVGAFPLAPQFATTAHAAQGQTYAKGAVTDMQIGDGGGPMTAYIAATRVKDREGWYIYGTFRCQKDEAWGEPGCCKHGAGTPLTGPRCVRDTGEELAQRMPRAEAQKRVHCGAVEEIRRRTGVQRMRGAPRGKRRAVAVLRLQSMEKTPLRRCMPARSAVSTACVQQSTGQQVRRSKAGGRIWRCRRSDVFAGTAQAK